MVATIQRWRRTVPVRKTYLALLLAHVDLPSVAEDNLKRLCLYAQSMGSGGSDVQFAVQTALRRQKKRKSDGSVEMYQPKRLCLGSWSPVLGGHSCSPKRLVKISEVLPDQFCKKLCLHDGAFYVSDPYNRRVLRIKPGEGDTQIVAGNGAPVNGFNDLSLDFDMVVSPTGDLFAMEGENENNLLVKFSHGFGEVLHENCPRIDDLFCSPNGVLYMLDLAGKRVQKFEGSRLKPVWSRDEHHDSLDWFEGDCICVTRDEVLYICGWCYDDDWQSRVQLLRFQPGSSKSTIVATGDWQAETCRFNLVDLCVTDDDRVFFLNPDLGICAMSLQETAVQDLGVNVASGLTVESLVVQGGSLYVVAIDLDGLGRDGIYEFELPRSLEVSSS